MLEMGIIIKDSKTAWLKLTVITLKQKCSLKIFRILYYQVVQACSIAALGSGHGQITLIGLFRTRLNKMSSFEFI